MVGNQAPVRYNQDSLPADTQVSSELLCLGNALAMVLKGNWWPKNDLSSSLDTGRNGMAITDTHAVLAPPRGLLTSLFLL